MSLDPPGAWCAHDGGCLWDYRKAFHELRMVDGTTRWAWPNNGCLLCMDTGNEIAHRDVMQWRENDRDYYRRRLGPGRVVVTSRRNRPPKGNRAQRRQNQKREFTPPAYWLKK